MAHQYGSKQVAFRAGDLLPALEARQDHEGGPGVVAKRDLERYYALLTRELAGLRLTEAEASLVCDVNNGIGLLLDPARACQPAMVWLNVEDSIRLNALDAKHGLDEPQGHQLVEKLKAMTPGQTVALVDAIERFWLSQEATVQSVGLVRG